LQPRGFSQHGGASRNSKFEPPSSFRRSISRKFAPPPKNQPERARVVVWLFRAECAAANAPIAEATLRKIPKAARTPREIEAAFATLVRDRAMRLLKEERRQDAEALQTAVLRLLYRTEDDLA
jgi:hypothetical protein